MQPLNLRIRFDELLSFSDIDGKELKKTQRKVGREVQKIARKLVSKRAVSKPGELPGMNTGKLRKAISYRPSRSGFSVGISSRAKGFNGTYYPPFVVYGHRGPSADKGLGVDGKKQHGTRRIGKKVAEPRANWIVEAAMKYGVERYGYEIRNALNDAIKPGVITR